MKNWPKEAVKWARGAVPAEITKMADEGVGPEALFDRLSERWKAERCGVKAEVPEVPADKAAKAEKPPKADKAPKPPKPRK